MEIKAQNISKEFKRNKGSSFFAIDPTNAELKKGKLTILKGRSGSGKSTLINILSGLITPTTGKVLIGGTDIYALNDNELSDFRNRHIGIVPQGQTALYTLNVLQNVCLPNTLSVKDGNITEYALELLSMLEIEKLALSAVSELSGGELRRVSAARALINRPDVIFADEPTGDLDDENTKRIFELFRQKADEGAAVLIATHEQCAENYADELWLMNERKLIIA